MAAPSVVVMADSPRPGRCNLRLEPRLGPNGCALLQAELIRVAVGWGRTLGPAFVAVTPPDAVDEVAAPGGERVRPGRSGSRRPLHHALPEGVAARLRVRR